MAAPYTQADVSAGFGLDTALNLETTKIETAFTTVLSKDSATDNTMNVDLDMGGNQILNVAGITLSDYDIAINDLTDVDTTGISVNDVLRWDGTNYVPYTIIFTASDIGITDAGGYFTGAEVETALQELGDTVSTIVQTGDNVSVLTNDAGYLITVAMNDLSDVDTTGISLNDVLQWNGTTFVPVAASSGGGTVDTVVAGDGITVDNTDPANPIVSSDFSVNSTSASYTLSATQDNQWTDITGSSSVDITCPPESTINLGSKFVHTLSNYGTGTVTVVAGAGVTVRPPPGGTLVIPQYATVGIKKADNAADTYIVFGPTVAV